MRVALEVPVMSLALSLDVALGWQVRRAHIALLGVLSWEAQGWHSSHQDFSRDGGDRSNMRGSQSNSEFATSQFAMREVAKSNPPAASGINTL